MAPKYFDAPESDDNDQWPADDIEGPDDDLDSGFDSMASDDYGDTDDGSDFGDGNDGNATAFSDGSDVDRLSKRLASVNFASAAPASRPMAKPQNRGGQRMCAVCGTRPAYSQKGKNYPTCGTTCAAKYKPSGNSGGGGRGGNNSAKIVILCVVCGKKPAYNQGGKSYPTCGNTCAGIYKTGTSTHLCVLPYVRPYLCWKIQYRHGERPRQRWRAWYYSAMRLLPPPAKAAASQPVRADVPRPVARGLPHVPLPSEAREVSFLRADMQDAGLENYPEDHGDSPGPCHMENGRDEVQQRLEAAN
ncbi:predicted protein [Postia placenta Mad-698-R]|nr:predicted protein [Postia placenta Mad-698-R]